MNENYHLITFGEILWDIYPDGHRIIGGAPLNVALRAHGFGLNVGIISRVGKDEMAMKLNEYLNSKAFNVELIQDDNDWETGYVNVSMDSEGVADYEIKKPSAWDYIKLTEKNIEAVEKSQVFLYGSLSARNDISKKTLIRLIGRANYKVLDVNLRPPYFDKYILDELMQPADFIKMNDDELSQICKFYDIMNDDINKLIYDLAAKTQTQSICVTRGAKGALLFHDGQFFDNAGYGVEVADTIGAGDSFLATLVTELLIQNKPPDDSLKNACAIGAIVASKMGANPDISISDIMSIRQNE